ncbi:hypothetical protein [Actinoplanes sp. NPDC049118]|uniref:hypothetical protein n=1 Tax=Actinoplanes sp. NPDC049118 TaxID=3155769 RepID=UPI0033E2A4CD
MNAYALLWQLIKHVLHGRGRDEVFLAVYRDPLAGPVTGELDDFSWEGDQDRFCVLSATDKDGRS